MHVSCSGKVPERAYFFCKHNAGAGEGARRRYGLVFARGGAFSGRRNCRAARRVKPRLAKQGDEHVRDHAAANQYRHPRAAVLRLLRAGHDPRNLSAVVEQALQAWLHTTACNDPARAQAAARGYQWKSLFLPEGTCLRSDYQHQT